MKNNRIIPVSVFLIYIIAAVRIYSMPAVTAESYSDGCSTGKICSCNAEVIKNPVNTGPSIQFEFPDTPLPGTKISYTITTNSMVSLKLYDMAGKVVRTLTDGYQKHGTHTVSFDTSNIAVGQYFYVLVVSTQNSEVVKTTRLTLSNLNQYLFLRLLKTSITGGFYIYPTNCPTIPNYKY